MKIYFFGDSISFGQYISAEMTWVHKIGVELRKQYPDMELLIQNPSINGNTTRMAWERMPYDIQSHEVDILVVGFGMNDCNYWVTDKGVPRVSLAGFEANMKEIIDRAYNFDVKEVIIHTNHPSPRQDIMTNTDITYSQSNHFYNDIIRKVAADDNRVRFVDIEQKMLGYEGPVSDLTLPDGVHLSLLGHSLYFKYIFECITQIIQGMKNKELKQHD